MADPAGDARAPRWAAPVTLALSVAGVVVSAYLTFVHYTEPTALSCPDNGAINCTKVITSPQSMVLGIPVAVLGVVFFVVMLALCSPWAWRSVRREVTWARMTGVAVGIGWVLYLVGVELLSVHAICLWCTAVHLLTFGLFVAVLAASLHVSEEPPLASRQRLASR